MRTPLHNSFSGCAIKENTHSTSLFLRLKSTFFFVVSTLCLKIVGYLRLFQMPKAKKEDRFPSNNSQSTEDQSLSARSRSRWWGM